MLYLLLGWCRKGDSAQPALPGPDHWDELPDATYKVTELALCLPSFM